jgi:hypothetical protein
MKMAEHSITAEVYSKRYRRDFFLLPDTCNLHLRRKDNWPPDKA